ncbi:MAG TPA: hypothetical protein IAB11_02685 [Candidatus Ornithoclostridium faecavium]|nr:hypothetical protein [Candidatus Ornithoclostridium faecavium]
MFGIRKDGFYIDGKPFDFVYDGYKIGTSADGSPMPLPRKYDESLRVRFVDRLHAGVALDLVYLTSREDDVIARYCELYNGGKKDIDILKFDSAQTDMLSAGKE